MLNERGAVLQTIITAAVVSRFPASMKVEHSLCLVPVRLVLANLRTFNPPTIPMITAVLKHL